MKHNIRKTAISILAAAMILLSGCGKASEDVLQAESTTAAVNADETAVSEMRSTNTQTTTEAVSAQATTAAATEKQTEPTAVKAGEDNQNSEQNVNLSNDYIEKSENSNVNDTPKKSQDTPKTNDNSTQKAETPKATQAAVRDETFFGILIDEDCSDFEDPPSHDLPCMLMFSCRDSGYGLDILQSDGSYRFYMFDEYGQQLAWDYLNKTTRMNGLYVTVTGTYENGVIKVKTFKES